MPDVLMGDDKPLCKNEQSNKEHYRHLEEKRKAAYDELRDMRDIKVTKENIVRDFIEL